MDKIKRLVNCIVPITVCNFKCHYCYLGQKNRFDTNIPKLQYSLDVMQKALTKERLGGPCLMNLCAVGETLIAPYIVDLTKKMLENGHYVAIVTNGILTNKLKKLTEFSQDERRRLFIKFSYHYMQLIKQNKLDLFYDNVRLIRDAKISYTVELTVNDESIPLIDEINESCVKNLGAKPHVIESRDENNQLKKLTKLTNEEHMKKWSKMESPILPFQDKLWGQKRKEFCYAGDWVLNLYLENGNLTPCFGGGDVYQNIFEDVDEPIHYNAIGTKCPWEHCFGCHVLLTLGAIPEMDTLTYEEIRNRKNKDGTEWLQPEVKHFYKSKFAESNELYSEDKKCLINWLKGIEYGGLEEDDINKLPNALENIFRKNNIKSVAIYEDEKYNSDLFNGLLHTSIKVKYTISPNYKETNSNIKTFIVHRLKYVGKKVLRRGKIPLLNYYDRLPKVDALLVCDSLNYAKIKKELKQKHKNINVVLITDLT